MKSKIHFLSLLLFVLNSGYSQEQPFVNKNQSLISLNPSFAGSNGLTRNQSSYTSQLGRYSSGYTALNSFDAYVKPLKAGIAVSALTNNVDRGLFTNNYLGISYAQYFLLLKGRLKLIPSLNLTYAEQRLDWKKAEIHTHYINPPPSKINYFDLKTGFLANYRDKLYAGFSISHLNRPNGNFFATRYGFNFHLSYNIKFSDLLQMQLIAQTQSEVSFSSKHLSANALLYKKVIAGIGLGSDNARIFNLGYRGNFFTLVGGYIVQNNGLDFSYNSFELHASFNLRNKEQRKTIGSFESW